MICMLKEPILIRNKNLYATSLHIRYRLHYTITLELTLVYAEQVWLRFCFLQILQLIEQFFSEKARGIKKLLSVDLDTAQLKIEFNLKWALFPISMPISHPEMPEIKPHFHSHFHSSFLPMHTLSHCHSYQRPGWSSWPLQTCSWPLKLQTVGRRSLFPSLPPYHSFK